MPAICKQCASSQRLKLSPHDIFSTAHGTQCSFLSVDMIRRKARIQRPLWQYSLGCVRAIGDNRSSRTDNTRKKYEPGTSGLTFYQAIRFFILLTHHRAPHPSAWRQTARLMLRVQGFAWVPTSAGSAYRPVTALRTQARGHLAVQVPRCRTSGSGTSPSVLLNRRARAPPRRPPRRRSGATARWMPGTAG